MTLGEPYDDGGVMMYLVLLERSLRSEARPRNWLKAGPRRLSGDRPSWKFFFIVDIAKFVILGVNS